MSLPIDVPPAEAPTPPAHAATPVPQPAGGAHHPGPAPSGHPAADEAATGPGPTGRPQPGTGSPPSTSAGAERDRASSGQRSSLTRELNRLGAEDEEGRLGALTRLTGHPVDALADLGAEEAGKLIVALKGCDAYADLLALYSAGDKPEAGDG